MHEPAPAPDVDPDAADAAITHVHPFVCADADGLSLHFSLHSIQSRMQRKAPDALALDYTRTMMAFLLLQPFAHPARPRLLMVGLGGGSLPKFCHARLPQADITVVEINPHVIALRDAFAVPADGACFRVVEADGAVHVAALAEPVDVLIIDGFDYDGQPEVLCSADFYAACRRAVAPGGVLVVNLQAADPQTPALRDRIAQAFDGAVLALPSPCGGNLIVLAGAPCLRVTAAGLRRQRSRYADWAEADQVMLRELAAQLRRAT